MKYTNLTFTELVNKIGISRYYDLPKMLKEAFLKLKTLIENLTNSVEALENAPTVDSRPYKVYTALLTQEGTDAPVATVLENTLGEDIIWTRDSSGSYYGDTIGNVFTFNKTFTTITNKKIQNLQFISMQSETQVYVEQIIRTTSVYQDYMVEIPIEIRVYN